MIHTASKYALAVLFAVTGLWLSPQISSASECAQLDRLQCETSPECMSVKDADGNAAAYLCEPAANACEADFQQMRTVVIDGLVDEDQSYDATAACEATPGCGIVPAGACYCPPLDQISCVCGGGAPLSCAPKP